MTGWRQINDDPPPVAHTAPADPPGPAPRRTTLDDAARRYRTAAIRLHNARTRSTLTRRDTTATSRQIAAANQAALDARHALEHARDELVAAALAHTGV